MSGGLKCHKYTYIVQGYFVSDLGQKRGKKIDVDIAMKIFSAQRDGESEIFTEFI